MFANSNKVANRTKASNFMKSQYFNLTEKILPRLQFLFFQNVHEHAAMKTVCSVLTLVFWILGFVSRFSFL
jgi:hypothetical protein